MELTKNENEKIQKLLYQIAVETKNYAKNLAPVRKGNLRDDIRIFTHYISKLEVEVGNTFAVDYAPYVHYGTGIYGKHKRKITPKKAKALDTPFGYKKSIKGQKAQPYLDDALKEIIADKKIDMLLNKFADDFSEDLYKNIKESLSKIS